MKVDMTKLKKMNFDEGKKYLIGLGYKDEDYAVIDEYWNEVECDPEDFE